jgi:O-antigen/teichoic acid export membrane protein
LSDQNAHDVVAAGQIGNVPGPHRQPRSGFGGVVARLASVNVVVILAGLVTGPLTARALGPDGRGELAIILSVLTLAPWVLDLGVSVWVGRERARGASRADVLGAALPVAVACSIAGVLAAIPLSRALGEERQVVVTFVQIGLFASPLVVVLQTLVGLAIGESRWGLFNLTRIVASVVPLVAVVVLASIGQLSVGAAAAAYLAGAVGGNLLLLSLVKGARRLVFGWSRSWAAATFGLRSWLSSLGNVANQRLDQVLMAVLVTSSELGLYAVAVTVAMLTSTLVGAVSSALFPRVAQGDPMLAIRSCRVTVGIVFVAGLFLAVITPAALPFVFGSDFDDSVPMALILLAASVPAAAATVLSAALQAVGDVGATMRAELVAVALSVPALVLVLPGGGGIAAAIVSLVAYTVRLGLELGPARRAFGARAASLLVPARSDVMWAIGQVRTRTVTPARPA